MTIQLPPDLESAVKAEVLRGRSASEDDLVAAAVREYLRQQPGGSGPPLVGDDHNPSLGSIGAMRDSAEELDEIVAEAYRQRREETWREPDL